MTPALAVDPSAALAPERPPRHASRAVTGGLVVGAFTGLWLDGSAPGLGFVLSAWAFAAVLAWCSGKEGLQTAKGQRWALGLALVFAALVGLRASPWLWMLDAGTCVWLLLLAAGGWNGEQRLSEASLSDVAAGPFAVAAHGAWSGGRAVSATVGGSDLGAGLRAGAGPLARTLLVAAPVLGLATALLAHGDAVFASRLGWAWDALASLPAGELLRAALVAAVVGPWSAGVVTWALRRRGGHVWNAARAEPPPSWRLGAAESFALVGGLALVLGLFGAVSLECALSPDACTLPPGATFSDYAREGFFELLAVAALVLVVLLVVPPRARVDGARAAALRWVSSGLVVAALPLLVSAFRRLSLYEEAYGFTRLRVSSQAGCVLIALLLVWRAATLWRWTRRFAIGAVLSSCVVALGLNALDLDAFVARENLARAEATGVVDTAYLAELSTDAAPALVAFARSSAPYAVRSRVTHEALGSLAHEAPRGVLGLNFSAWRGHRLLVAHLAGLEQALAQGPERTDCAEAP